MRIVCEGCGAKYSVADEKVRGRSVTIRCKKCSAAMSVMGPADEAPAPRADLFAASDTSPFEGAPTHATPAPTAASTGARHESSVLFSLASLASATAAPIAAAAPAGVASADASGLLDIRALAGATGIGAAKAASTAPTARVDDLLGLGAPALALGSALAPPIVMPEAKPAPRSSRALLTAAAILGLGALGGAGVLAHATTSRAAATPAPAPIATHAVVVPAPLTPPADVHPMEPPIAGTMMVDEVPLPVAPSEPARAPRHPRTPVAVREPVATTPTETTSRAPRTLEDLIDEAAHPAPHAHATPPPAPSLPPTPSRTDVMSAMSAVTPQVVECGAGTHGVATVQVTLASDGHVSNAVVGGALAGTPEGSCIARAVRHAHVPAFQQTSFGFSYPFRL